MGHNPRLTKRFAVVVSGLLAKGVLQGRAREIVILRMGWRCGSIYEFGQHTAIGLDAGLTGEEIRQLTLPPEEGPWDSDELALIRFVDELYDSNVVSNATWATLARRWVPGELVELLIVAGFYWMVSGFLNSCRIPVEPGARGWPADRLPPGIPNTYASSHPAGPPDPVSGPR
jgi:alkylhydroperoxidase family enzyme